MTNTINLLVHPDDVKSQIIAVFTAWGMSPADASGSAEVMLEADLNGIDSHGITTLLYYEGLFRSGAINRNPNVRTVVDTPGIAVIDADGALGHAVSVRAMDLACEKAGQIGVGVVAVRQSDHYGAAGYYVAQASRNGKVGMALSNGFTRCVVPAGGVEPMFSTNPIAFGAPGDTNKPFMFDVATSTVSIGKVNLAWLSGKPIPPGWVIGADGSAITDAEEARKVIYDTGEGGLTPLGGTPEMSAHKGYGLSAMVEILSAVLPGALAAPLQNQRERDGGRTNTGHFFMALDPELFRGRDAFCKDMDDMMSTLRSSRAADPVRPVLVPGDIEWKTYASRTEQGIPMSTSLLQKLAALVERAGATQILPIPTT